jgi:hypothetical protein
VPGCRRGPGWGRLAGGGLVQPCQALSCQALPCLALPCLALSRPCLAPGGGAEDPLSRGVPVVREAGIVLLGAPLGDHLFTQQTLAHRFAKVRRVTELLPTMLDPHCEFVLLRGCLALTKVAYNLRTVDTTVHSEVIEEFDRTTREALSRILGSPLRDRPWRQANLTASTGGLGLRAARDLSAAAYAASVLSSRQLVSDLLHGPADMEPCEAALLVEAVEPTSLPAHLLQDLSIRMGEAVSVEALEGMKQKELTYKIDQHNLKELAEVH